MLLVAAVMLAASMGCASGGMLAAPADKRYESTRICMGVKARLVAYAPDWPRAERAFQEAFGAIATLDASMSDYRSDSEISLLAAGAGGGARAISPDLARVLGRAQRISLLSGGAFDATVGPLSRVWREARAQGGVPDTGEIESARGRVGWQYLEVDEEGRTARLTRAGMGLDLGGIAKGYAAQRAVEVMKSRGLNRCMAALAGDVALGDAPPGERGWLVELHSGTSTRGVLVLLNCCVSTSGDAEQALEVGGVRYSHIIDPRTGMGATNRAWAAVIAPRGEDADALASAACVLGATQGAALIRRVPGACGIVESDEAVEGGRVERRRETADPAGMVERARVK